MLREILPTIVAGALAAGTLGACSSDGTSEAGETGPDARSPAQLETGETGPARAARGTERYALATNNACLQARRQGGPGSELPRVPSELRAYARGGLARSGLTLSVLSQARPPGTKRPALRALQAEYTRLMGLYRQAAVVKGASAEPLLGAVEFTERAVARKAVAAGLGACAPEPGY